MQIERHKPLLETYQYAHRIPDKEYETKLNVGFAPLQTSDPNYPKENSILGARLEFNLVFKEYVLSGSISQVNHLINRQVKNQEDLTKEEIDEIVAPLFDIVERITYEVTEIATDEPGLKLNFQNNATQAEGE